MISGICLFCSLESNENVKFPGRKIYQAFQNVGYNLKTFSMKGKNCLLKIRGKMINYYNIGKSSMETE